MNGNKKTDLPAILLAWVEKRDRNHLVINRQVSCDLQLLSPATWKEDRKKYYTDKIRFSLLILGAGLALTLILGIQSETQGQLRSGTYIERGGYEEPSRQIELVADCNGETTDMTVEVGEIRYTPEQTEELYERALEEVERIYLGQNESPEHVDRNLSFVTGLKGYPFQITWECEDYRVVEADGTIAANTSKEGVLTSVTATFAYDTFRASRTFPLLVFPPVLTPQEMLANSIREAVLIADAESRYTEKLSLPTEVPEGHVAWKEKKDRLYLVFPLLSLLIAISLFFMKDKDLHKELLLREKQIGRDYPDMVSKLSVYMGAGMTIRGAMEKLVEEYEKQKELMAEKRFLYEEMKVAMTEMQSGISEAAAYERFGRRCSSQLMLKFSNLVVQNLKKGSTGLHQLLRMEAENAMRERRNEIKKLGEETSTKLLLPMMMQLCVVMIMIMVPAFITFGN